MTEKSDKLGVYAVTQHLAASTTMHGPSHIVGKTSLAGKIFWLFVMGVALGFLVWQFRENITKYYQYPSKTTTKIETAGYLMFPAVTICNINPVRLSMVGNLSGGLQNVMKENHQRPPSMDKANYSEMKGSFSLQNNFYQLYSLLREDEKKEYGHLLNWMLIDCTWNGRQCSAMNFTHFLNWKYGNCYTFNQGINRTIAKSRQSGPAYGLRLVLNIQSTEYTKELTESLGVKLVIHNQTDMPFPEDRGLFISPGQETSIGIKLVRLIRQKDPWDNCLNVTHEFLTQNNAYLKTLANLKHTATACKNTCVQSNIIKKCNCSSYKFANKGPVFTPLEESGYTLAVCDVPGMEYGKTCMGQEEMASQRACQKFTKCPLQCIENNYQTSYSTTRWPNEDNMKRHLSDMKYMAKDIGGSGLMKDITTLLVTGSASAQMAFLQTNVAVLNVYFEDFNVQTFETAASYTEGDLLSDLGGTLGLWMGLSVITIVEFIEFFIELFRLLTSTKVRPNRRGQGPPQGEVERKGSADSGRDTKISYIKDTDDTRKRRGDRNNSTVFIDPNWDRSDLPERTPNKDDLYF